MPHVTSEQPNEVFMPWQQDSVEHTTQFYDITNANFTKLHSTLPEIDDVANANLVSADSPHGTVARYAIETIPEEEPQDVKTSVSLDSPELSISGSCSFNNCNVPRERLRTSSCSSRQCYCTAIDEGETGNICPWGSKRKSRTLGDDPGVAKRKSVFQRLTEHKYRPFVFQHDRDISSYMWQYRKYHTVADVGREVRAPPEFGVDVPDPYAVRIKNICSIVDTCDFTALLPNDTEHSCSDFNSVISTTSGESGSKDKGQNKSPASEKSKRKRGEKPPLLNTRSVPSLAPVRQKAKGMQGGKRTTRDYVEEYEDLRRERESLHKSNTLPQILLRTNMATEMGRSPSESSVLARRLIDELDSPFKRFLRDKHFKQTSEFLSESRGSKSTSVKLSEFLSNALLGDDNLRTSKKSQGSKSNVKVNSKSKEDNSSTHLPELVDDVCDKKRHKKGKSISQSCTTVLSLSLGDIEVPRRHSNNPPNSPEDKIPLEYKLKKQKIHKVVDLMSVTR